MFGRLHVAPKLSEYLARHADVVGSLQLADRLVSLVEEGIDLAVRIGNLPDSGAIVRRVGRRHGASSSLHRAILPEMGQAPPAGGRPAPCDDRLFRPCRSGRLAVRRWRAGYPHCLLRRAFRPTVPMQPSRTPKRMAVSSRSSRIKLPGRSAQGGSRSCSRKTLNGPILPIQIVYPAARMLPLKVRAFIGMIEADADWDFARL